MSLWSIVYVAGLIGTLKQVLFLLGLFSTFCSVFLFYEAHVDWEYNSDDAKELRKYGFRIVSVAALLLLFSFLTPPKEVVYLYAGEKITEEAIGEGTSELAKDALKLLKQKIDVELGEK